MAKKSMISQLASVSEGALGKLTSSDLSKTALSGALMLKEKVERLMSSMTDLDERMVKLEARVEALEGKATPAAKRTTASAAKRTTASKPAAKPAPKPAAAKPKPAAAAEPPPTGEPAS